MAITLLTHTSSGDSANDGESDSTPNIVTTGANFLATGVAYYDGNTPTVRVVDSKSNTWSARTVKKFADFASQIYYSKPVSVGTGHNVTVDSNPTTALYPSIHFASFAGVHATPYDGESAGGQTTGQSVQPGSLTPSVDGCLILAMLCCDALNVAGLSINGGFTLLDPLDNTGNVAVGGAMAYLIQTSKAAVNPTFAWSGATIGSAVMAAFKPAEVASGGGGINSLLGITQVTRVT